MSGRKKTTSERKEEQTAYKRRGGEPKSWAIRELSVTEAEEAPTEAEKAAVKNFFDWLFTQALATGGSA